MRVLLGCDFFLKYSVEQATALADLGHDVMLVCRGHALEFAGDRAERDAWIARAAGTGVRVVEMPGRMREARAARALLDIRSAIHGFAPDVVHVHQLTDPRLLALVPRRSPTVLTLHDVVLHPGHVRPGSAIKRRAVSAARDLWQTRARVIVVHSERLKSLLALRGGQRSVVIAHGLTVADVPLPVPETPAVGLFGRMEAYKGLDVLATAMPLVWERRPDVQVRVAGSGPMGFGLIDPRVELIHRYVSEAELADLHRRTSLLVLPYIEASQSGAGSVAIGSGIPIVASDLGGLPDLVLDGSYLVPPSEPDQLAAAILAHVDDGPDVRMRVLEELGRPRSWAAGARASVDVYEQLRER